MEFRKGQCRILLKRILFLFQASLDRRIGEPTEGRIGWFDVQKPFHLGSLKSMSSYFLRMSAPHLVRPRNSKVILQTRRSRLIRREK